MGYIPAKRTCDVCKAVKSDSAVEWGVTLQFSAGGDRGSYLTGDACRKTRCRFVLLVRLFRKGMKSYFKGKKLDAIAAPKPTALPKPKKLLRLVANGGASDAEE